ncbi:MAG: hypothetical protein KAI53_04160 [Candidatus Aenigmarchaeota archaeon]|nr:hypothetical protein [Candidatus Aenigmarchaeota archaeon]
MFKNNKSFQMYALTSNSCNAFIIAPVTTKTHNKLFFSNSETAKNYVERHTQIKNSLVLGSKKITNNKKYFIEQIVLINNKKLKINELTISNIDSVIYYDQNSSMIVVGVFDPHIVTFCGFLSGVYEHTKDMFYGLDGIPISYIIK